MYLPAFYYPIQEDDRATGFLMPIYGNSTYRGQTLTNQFFWAIGRSMDATFSHDWFTKTGHGYGGEYRYVASGSSSGNATVYVVNEKPATTTVGGVTTETPGLESYQIRSNITQALPLRTRLTANVDYFSSITVQQLYQQDLYQATRSTRNWGAATTTSLSGFTLSGAYNRYEVFLDEQNSYVEGSRPRITLTRSSQQLGRAPVYVNGNVEFLGLQREYRQETAGEIAIVDQGLTRIDGQASVRMPFPTFTFMTVTSTLAWNGTRYSKSVDPDLGAVPEPLFRKYFTVGTEVIGPSFVRIFNRPGSTWAARMKHLIEPRVEFTRMTAIDDYNRIPKYDSSDYRIGGSTQIRYSGTNRLLVKPAGDNAVSRDLLSVTVSQTYYTDPRTSQIDPQYGSSFRGRPPSAFSPVSVSTAYRPATASRVSARLEYDPIISAMQHISVGGEAGLTNVFVSGSFSRRRRSQAPGPSAFNTLLNLGTEVRTTRNMLGGSYSIDYDFGRSVLVQQRIQGYYNAQCCGLILEYQQFNYPTLSNSLLIPQDRRFNISFSLGGIGTFSNFLGALAGQPTRR
jgi:LPS-assembly protein